ncbi:MAG: SpoVT / AbrB like domain protein [Candidatus Bathyarchaeota archaeon BA1]|nr:MAG: SpoVT / AbrB like domain protein [Candidatus Bathyarchaeota archaeon BA1]
MVLEATIVIPKEVREKGGIKEGDVLEVSVKEEVIVLLRDTTWERVSWMRERLNYCRESCGKIDTKGEAKVLQIPLVKATYSPGLNCENG